jgi:hypothetical protein
MQRLACLILGITAACTSGTPTGEAGLSGVQPPVMSAAAETFTGPDAEGNKVMGWKILLYQNSVGSDCLEGTILASVGIFTNDAAGSKPQALLPTGGISIVATSPPSLMASARAATMGAQGVASITGLLEITEFHLTADAQHADRIKGTIAAGGTDAGSGEGVLLNGSFTAPVCTEE